MLFVCELVSLLICRYLYDRLQYFCLIRASCRSHKNYWIGSSSFYSQFTRLQTSDLYRRLKLLHIDSLEKRRLKADLAFTYTIIFGLVNLNISDVFALRTDCMTRGHPYILALANNTNALRRNLLSVRVIKPFNSLSANNDNFKSFTSFRFFLNNCDLSKLCKY